MIFTSNYIAEQITKHKPERDRMIRLYQNYKGEKLEVESKEVSATSKTNNKIKTNYRGIIIDQKNGYLFGKPIQFGLDSMVYQENLYKLYDDELKKFLRRNNANDTFAETDKMSSICGYGVWFCYHDSMSKERFVEVNPWDCIIIEDNRLGTRHAIYYYTVTVTNAKGEKEMKTMVECYDETTCYYFIEENGAYKPYKDEQAGDVLRVHGFSFCPLIKVRNNDEEKGDFEKVEDSINKLEFTISTIQDEIDQFRLAYMLITGAELDAAELEKIKNSGAFSGLEPEDKVEFITKQINDGFLENHKKTLIDEIFKGSATVDFNSESFTAESGESRKWKLIMLENKAIIKERKYEKALMELFETIASSWNLKGFAVDYLDIYWIFSRNIPVDLLYLADVSMKLKGMVSEETRLGLLSGIVDDVEWEKKKMAEESVGNISLDDYDKELMNPSGSDE